jgi:hypothetical protein
MTSSWQPIDTAPTEDGTKALLFDGRDQFVGVLTHLNRKAQWRLWTGEKPVPWDESIPTHWMPLPPPAEGRQQTDISCEPGAAATEPSPGEEAA